MSSWADRRKATYILGFSFIILIIISFFLFRAVNRPASCSDGIQNQGETGIDCGGPCSTLCRAQYVAPSVLWVTWAKVLSAGTYNVLAYAQNPNLGAGAAGAPYYFKIYDAGNVLLYSATGTAYVPADNNFVVFADSINLHDKVPARIEFSFLNPIDWQKAGSSELGINVLSKTPQNLDTAPKVLATLQNTTILPIQNIQSVVILYDANDNAIGFSKTKTDSIAAGATANIVFTWPEAFTTAVDRIDIISEVLPK